MLVKLNILTTIETGIKNTVYLFSKENKCVIPVICCSKTSNGSTYKLLKTLINLSGLKFLYVKIYMQLEDTYYTYAVLSKNKKIFEINCDISDTLTLAQLMNVEVFITEKLMQDSAIFITKELLEYSLTSFDV